MPQVEIQAAGRRVLVDCSRSGLATVTARALELWRATDDPRLTTMGFSPNGGQYERGEPLYDGR